MIGVEIITGLLGAIITIAAKAVVEYVTNRRTRTLTIAVPGEAPETITVDGRASQAEISDAVRRAIDFESLVSEHLRLLTGASVVGDVVKGTTIDFVVNVRGNTIAIEAKADPSHLSRGDLLKYLRAEPGADKLLLVSGSAPPQGLQQAVADLVRENRVQFVYPTVDSPVEITLRKALSSEGN